MTRGYTVRDIAARYRVGEDKVRGWIKRGELLAINTSTVLCGRPRYVVTPEAIAKFEATRPVTPSPKPQRRKRKPAGYIDFFPD